MDPVSVPATLWLLLALTFWSLPLKGYALWKAASRGEKWWFIALFVINSAAILEIIYLFFVIPRKGQAKNQQ
ncbi:hypothetical protein A2671_00735 [Candidatus Kaiserbacteria bacterium RIFCSPHIGHO2_01_FULL_49_13]|uniref:DUF5652 domain-containing protein n=1 Tax=Candidatus Kaiserbacteria bacterium RIFCSPHIGHO2_01_FULL_49_13 TaxID=1798477 RepID=A0A1F6CDZ4_9BACT|nr:MAG: hypothetical protein A2671_00735 [Candidatus Kaiserbacteria bacterium RIFCSPHIGHO2_01_FULL_49_13]